MVGGDGGSRTSTIGTALRIPLCFEQPIVPTGYLNDRQLQQHPEFCHVCCNFSADCVGVLFPRFGTLIAWNLGPPSWEIQRRNVDSEHGQGTFDRINRSYIGPGDIQYVKDRWPDYTSCSIQARFDDIYRKARDGCASCHLLRTAVEEVAAQQDIDLKTTLASDHVMLELVFCRGDVLTVSVKIVDEASANDDGYDILEGSGFYGEPAREEKSLFVFECYTLPGKQHIHKVVLTFCAISGRCAQSLYRPDLSMARHRVQHVNPTSRCPATRRWLCSPHSCGD